MKISKTIFSTILMLFMLVFNSGAFNGPAVPVEPDPTPSTPPPNQGFSLSMSGGSTVTEGNSLTFTITSSDATVINPQWTVTRIGSQTEVLKEHTKTVSENGLEAAVVFYWYPGTTPGSYKVEFSCVNSGSVCSVDKIVTCTIPKEGARTPVKTSIKWEEVRSYENGYAYAVLTETGWSTYDPYIEYNVPANSPFREGRDGQSKFLIHEQKHVEDYTKPASGESLAANYAAAYLAQRCDPYYNVVYDWDDLLKFKRTVLYDTGEKLLDWLEERAYPLSDPIWPTCAYTGNPRAK